MCEVHMNMGVARWQPQGAVRIRHKPQLQGQRLDGVEASASPYLERRNLLCQITSDRRVLKNEAH